MDRKWRWWGELVGFQKKVTLPTTAIRLPSLISMFMFLWESISSPIIIKSFLKTVTIWNVLFDCPYNFAPFLHKLVPLLNDQIFYLRTGTVFLLPQQNEAFFKVIGAGRESLMGEYLLFELYFNLLVPFWSHFWQKGQYNYFFLQY